MRTANRIVRLALVIGAATFVQCRDLASADDQDDLADVADVPSQDLTVDGRTREQFFNYMNNYLKCNEFI